MPIAAIIPVFNPEPGLLPLVKALLSHLACVIVVDDGSVEACEVFNELPDGVILLRHTANQGKGAALKTAFAYLQKNCPTIAFAVTVDGDGQHTLPAVEAVVERAVATDRVTFGVRSFVWGQVPFRSWWGNHWTALEVRLFLGLKLADTQTGLRCFPSRLFPRLLSLPGFRFEYEAAQLRFLSLSHEPLEQVPIPTVYVAGNRASHYRPLRDTLLTQFALLRVGGEAYTRSPSRLNQYRDGAEPVQAQP